MRITLLTLGTHGDVQPFVALGVGLQRARHVVRLAARDKYRSFVTSHGLEFASLGDEVDDEKMGKAIPTEPPGKLVQAVQLTRSFLPGHTAPSWPETLPWLDWLVERSFKACEGADAVVSGIMTLWANSLAEKLKVPWFIGLLQPCTPTRAFPSLPFMPYVPSTLGGGLNRLTHRIAARVFFETILRMTNLSREEILGLPPLMNTKPLARFYNKQTVILYAYSPTLSPKPDDWPEWHHVTGYWYLDQASNWNPPSSLVDFLANGPSPVCVGFGSFQDKDPKRLTAVIVEALSRTGQRGILLTGWGGLKSADLPQTIFPIESVPHDWLYPRVAAVVHHGGAGTVGAALRAGVPSVSIPWRRDHPFFAACAHRIGVSPHPIPKNQLSVDRLAAAIDLAVRDQRIREHAVNVAKQVGTEDGVQRAIQIIEETMRHSNM